MPDQPLAPVAMFWTNAPLSFVERLCIQSFLDVGHPLTMYSYEPVDGLPDGVEARDAREIMACPDEIPTHERTDSPALFSDVFRYRLLRRRPGVIWSDTDAYCLRPFRPVDGYLFSWDDAERKTVASGVLAMPADSPALRELNAWAADPEAVLPWLPPRILAQALRRKRDGDPMTASEMPWGALGPQALTWELRQSKEIRYALPSEVLYPVHYSERGRYFRRARLTWQACTPATQSIHFYGRRVRDRLATYHDGVPPKGTILDRLASRHGIAA
ncbi:hypothetical protein [Jannaschia sp. W003]|uniref:hypothetical protein n=1 Tax=Jannaschia sp. W003 TaxID=2867012 RepID=UPI0021A91817|nr:hypothetical protein [Jannaschia sp. W003]UWQ21258.1 hypothetical protein K3554_14985 [Jannaschia sp. W003]